MVLAMSLALLMRSTAKEGHETQVFAGVFFIISVGATVVTLNAQARFFVPREGYSGSAMY